MGIPKEIQTAACLGLARAGNLSSVSNSLGEWAGGLTQNEVAEFYLFLRHNSQRWEKEWRSEFSELLGVSEAELPEPDPSSQWSPMLHHLVESGDLARLRSFVEALGIARWNLGPMGGESYDIYPLDDPDEKGETPIAKAARLKFHDMEAYLRTVRNTVVKNSR
jgi:hypothetical protein